MPKSLSLLIWKNTHIVATQNDDMECTCVFACVCGGGGQGSHHYASMSKENNER